MVLNNSIESFFNLNKGACIGIYFLLMFSVLTITTLLEKLCVQLKIKAKLSSGIVAGVLLGVITSLPELVTCLTSVIENKAGAIGFGDIMGSNIFDLFVMCVCVLVCVKLFIDHKVNKINVQTLACVGLGTLWCVFAVIFGDNGAVVWHGFNFFSILILLSYGLAVFFMTRNARVKTADEKHAALIEAKENAKSPFAKLQLKWIIVLIAVVAAVLVTASVFLTYTSTSLIRVHWNLGESFGGALLLGICTSLPEIVVCVNLCINKEYNMVIDTMVGSCAFNLSILTISNIAYAIMWKQGMEPMYPWTTGTMAQTIICTVIGITSFIYLMFNRPKAKAKLNKKQQLAINISLLSLVVIEYAIFMVLGFVYA